MTTLQAVSAPRDETSDLPLDAYPSAHVAVGLRKLSTSYAGPLIEVENDSASKLDIGANPDGSLDTEALQAHIGSGDGEVTTWYDQTASAAHFTAGGTVPVMIAIGGEILRNSYGRPVVRFFGEDCYLTTGSAIAVDNQSLLVVHVWRSTWRLYESDQTGSGQGIILESSANNNRFLQHGTGFKDGTVAINNFGMLISGGAGNTVEKIESTQVLSTTGDSWIGQHEQSTAVGTSPAGDILGWNLGHKSTTRTTAFDSEEFYTYSSMADDPRKQLIATIDSHFGYHPRVKHDLIFRWKESISDWLGRQSESSYDLTQGTLSRDGTAYADADSLVRSWMINDGTPNSTGGFDLLRYDSKWFLLDDGNGAGFVGSGIERLPRYPALAVSLWHYDLPTAGGQGNPYYHNPALAKRIAACMLAAMWWYDDEAYARGGQDLNFAMGGSHINNYILCWDVAKTVLTGGILRAAEVGVEAAINMLHVDGIQGANGNIDHKGIHALGSCCAASSSQVVKQRATDAINLGLYGTYDGPPSITDTTMYRGTRAKLLSASNFACEDGWSADSPSYGGVAESEFSGAVVRLNDEPTATQIMQSFSDRFAYTRYHYLVDPSGWSNSPSGHSTRIETGYPRSQRDNISRLLSSSYYGWDGMSRTWKLQDQLSFLVDQPTMESDINPASWNTNGEVEKPVRDHAATYASDTWTTDSSTGSDMSLLAYQEVQLFGDSLPPNYSEGVRYWVVNATSTTYQLSETAGGDPITDGGTGSATVMPMPTYFVFDWFQDPLTIAHQWWPDEDHWPHVDNWYWDLKARIDSQPARVLSPWEQGGAFELRTGENQNDWWFSKTADTDTHEMGWIVETMEDAGHEDGWRGGTCQAFWTREAGASVWCCRPSQTSRDWTNFRSWATTHLCGQISDGNAFSTIATKNPTTNDGSNYARVVSHDVDSSSFQITLNSTSTDGFQSTKFSQPVDFATVFTRHASGLQIDWSTSPTAGNTIDELWATVPLFMQETVGGQSPLRTLEYLKTSTWTAFDPAAGLVSSIERLRLGVNHGSGTVYTYVGFGSAVDARCYDWTTDQQQGTTTRAVQINLLGAAPGSSVAFPTSSLSVLITPDIDAVPV